VTCSDAQRLLNACLDGELDLERTLDVEAHIADCATCSAEYANLRALRAALRSETSALYRRAPADLARRVRGAVRAEEEAAKPAYRRRRPWAFAAGTLAFAALVLIGIILPIVRTGTSSAADQDRLVADLVDDHVRSLMAAHLMDVASTDRHTVRPWFSGKIDFSPPVVDLSASGFALVGGRLDDLDERPVAALVYRHGKHWINVFVWPVSANAPEPSGGVATHHGYNIVFWRSADLNYAAVSDAAQPELVTFEGLLRGANTVGPAAGR
jgi:anti-sigma factor RsiW